MKVEKIELNSEGIREMLRSEECRKIVSSYADQAANRLGEGYESDSHVGKGRVNARVNAVTWKAVNGNKKDNRMIKAVLMK